MPKIYIRISALSWRFLITLSCHGQIWVAGGSNPKFSHSDFVMGFFDFHKQIYSEIVSLRTPALKKVHKKPKKNLEFGGSVVGGRAAFSAATAIPLFLDPSN